MDLYKNVSYQLSRSLTLRYSSSFGLSSRLFARTIRPDVYAVYGLVRVADEIVDSYIGTEQLTLLDSLETETYAAIKRGYSTNPIVHSFALTAKAYGINKTLIAPFFESMRMDITPKKYDSTMYSVYIHGSAEVIGLMCLRVFCLNNTSLYKKLAPGAAKLGAAYQKVNFLRDMAADYKDLGRIYFPGVTYEKFNDTDKDKIVCDIQSDFDDARASLMQLPSNSRAAVMTSVVYYQALLDKLSKASVATLKTKRVRLSTFRKLWLLALSALRYKVYS